MLLVGSSVLNLTLFPAIVAFRGQTVYLTASNLIWLVLVTALFSGTIFLHRGKVVSHRYGALLVLVCWILDQHLSLAIASDIIWCIMMMHEGNHFRENGDDVWLEFRNFPDWLVIDERQSTQTLALCGVEYLDVRTNDQFRDHDRLLWYIPKGYSSHARRPFPVQEKVWSSGVLRNLGIDSSVLPESQEEEAACGRACQHCYQTALLAFANEQLVTLSRKFPFSWLIYYTFSFEVIYLVLMLVTLVNMISELTAGVPIVPRMENTTWRK